MKKFQGGDHEKQVKIALNICTYQKNIFIEIYHCSPLILIGEKTSIMETAVVDNARQLKIQRR